MGWFPPMQAAKATNQSIFLKMSLLWQHQTNFLFFNQNFFDDITYFFLYYSTFVLFLRLLTDILKLFTNVRNKLEFLSLVSLSGLA